jgi:hypothetical protein
MFQCLFFHAYLLTKKRKQMINNNGSNGQVNNINNSNNKASFIKDESKGEKVMSTISNKTKEMVLKVTKDLKTKLVSASTSNEVITHIISALTVNAVAGGGIDNIGEDDLQALYEVVTGANSEDTTFSRKVVTILNISKEAALCIGLYNNPSGLLTQRIIRNAAPQATAALIPAIIYTLLGDKAPAWAKKPFELTSGMEEFNALTTTPSIPLVGSKVFTFSNYGNEKGETVLEVKWDINSNTVSWGSNNHKVYSIIERLLEVSEKSEYLKRIDIEDQIFYNKKNNEYKELNYVQAQYIIEKSDPTRLISRILDKLASIRQYRSAQNLLNSLLGTVLVSEWESSLENPNDYNKASIQPRVGNLVDSQEVILTDEVVAYHVNADGVLVSNTESESYSNWVEGCLEAATKYYGFCLPDKTNTKRAFAEDAVTVMGVSANGLISMTGDNKGGKFFNRLSMVKHIAAKVPTPRPDNVMAEISGDRLAAHYGTKQESLWLDTPLLSVAVGDGGALIRNPLQAFTNKRFSGGLNLDTLLTHDEEYALTVDTRATALVNSSLYEEKNPEAKIIISDVKKHLDTYVGTVLAPDENIDFKGIPLVKNNSNIEVQVVSYSVRGELPINTEVRSIKVELTTEGFIAGYNQKLRGQGFKGVTTRNDNVVVEGDTSNIIFNGNSVKNPKGTLIRMWANATDTKVAFCKDGEFRYVEINKELKKYEITSRVVNFNKVQQWLNSATKTYKVSIPVNTNTYKVLSDATPSAFSKVSKMTEEGENTILEFEAQGIQAPLVYAIELSSIPENFAINRPLSLALSMYITTFSAGISANISASLGKQVKALNKTLEIASSDKVDEEFDYDEPELGEVLKNADKNKNPRDMFKALASKFPYGIKIYGATTEGTRKWEIELPFHILSVQSGFDKLGYAYDERIRNVYGFLTLLKFGSAATEKLSHRIADYAYGLATDLKEWKNDVSESFKGLGKDLSIYVNHSMKVLTNSSAGYESYNGVLIPVILLNESNPLVTGEAIAKNGSKVKKVADGDKVLFYRNPMLDLTPAIIRVTKNNSICDKYTCALSADVLAFSSQTDNDGDTISIIPVKQFGYTEDISVLAKHPLVGREIAEETMKVFGRDNLYQGILQERKETFNVLNPCNSITIDVITEANKVANHYRVRVGQGYSTMFNAFADFTDRYNKGEEISHAEIVGIKAASNVMYEELGLAGYTNDSEDLLATLAYDAKGLRGKVKKAAYNPFESENTLEARAALVKYVAITQIQAGLKQGKNVPTLDLSLKDKAIRFHNLRELTKKVAVTKLTKAVEVVILGHKLGGVDNTPSISIFKGKITSVIPKNTKTPKVNKPVLLDPNVIKARKESAENARKENHIKQTVDRKAAFKLTLRTAK